MERALRAGSYHFSVVAVATFVDASTCDEKSQKRLYETTMKRMSYDERPDIGQIMRRAKKRGRGQSVRCHMMDTETVSVKG